MLTLSGRIRRQIEEAVPTWIYTDDAGSGCPTLYHRLGDQMTQVKEAETHSQVSHALSSIKNNLMLIKKTNLLHSPSLLIFIANLWTRYYSIIRRGNSGSRGCWVHHCWDRTASPWWPACLSLLSCLWRTAPAPYPRRGWCSTMLVSRKRHLLYKKLMETREKETLVFPLRLLVCDHCFLCICLLSFTGFFFLWQFPHLLYYYFSFAAAPSRDSASSALIPALAICLQFSTLEMNGKKKTENISKNIEFIFLNQIKI